MYSALGTDQIAKRSLKWGDKSGAVWQATDGPSGALPDKTAWSALTNITLAGDVTIPAGKALVTLKEWSGAAADLTINLGTSSPGYGVYVPSGSSGTFADTGVVWSPKDVTIKSGTTLKGHTATIQRALDLASTHGYSTVNAGSGTYDEEVSMKSGVDLIGTAGSANTTIQHSGGTPVTFNNVSSRLSGFTLKGYNGIALYSSGSSNSEIDHNIIKDSYAGAYISNSNPTIDYNTITANGTGEGGGGMYAYSSHPHMENGHNKVQSNGGYGIACSDYSEPYLGTEGNNGMNDLNGNSGYNLTANSNCDTIYAQGNWWGTTDTTTIKSKLSHGKGLNWIKYQPFEDSAAAKPVVIVEEPRVAAARAEKGLGQALLREGRPAEALIHFKRVIAEYGETDEALLALDLLMNAYETLADKTDRLSYLDWVAQRYAQPELGALAAEFGVQVLLSSGQYAQALGRAEELAQRYPDRERTEWVRFQIGLIHELLGQPEKETEAFRAFLARYPVDTKNRPNDLLPSLARIQLGLDPFMGDIAVKSASTAPVEDGRQVVFEPVMPNPSNPQTTLAFVLPHEGEVTLVICNTLGQVVRTLVDHTRFTAGRQRLVWNGRDASGQEVPSGVYFARLTAGAATSVRKLLLLK